MIFIAIKGATAYELQIGRLWIRWCHLSAPFRHRDRLRISWLNKDYSVRGDR